MSAAAMQLVVLAALKMWVLPKFNGCSMRQARGFRRANGAKGLLPFGEGGAPEPPWYFAAHALLIDESRAARDAGGGTVHRHLETCLVANATRWANRFLGGGPNDPAIYLPSDTALL